jgi:hypothetical protein
MLTGASAWCFHVAQQTLYSEAQPPEYCMDMGHGALDKANPERCCLLCKRATFSKRAR